MFKPIIWLEKILYVIRDAAWSYPDFLFTSKNSLYSKLSKIYLAFIPFTHFLLSFLIVASLVGASFFYNPNYFVLGSSSSSVLKEGVVMGINPEGNVQLLSRVNPIVPTNIQLEKDLVELIYEPLLDYTLEQSGDSSQLKVTPVLAEEIIKFREGADYQFRLRKNVYWHDNAQFNADDVIKTFDTVSTLNVSNAYVQAIKQLQWEKVDNFNVRICTKDPNRTTSCDGNEDSPIFSNFLELVSIPVIPEHLSNDINAQSINTSEPELFRRPIGTGPYIFKSVSPTSAKVDYNENYYAWDNSPKIKTIVFELFKTTEDAIIALKNSEIHTLSTISVENLKDLKQYQFVNAFKSDIIDQQYWGLYFNLRKTPDGDAVGKDFLLDANVRKAISFAINSDGLIESALGGVAQRSLGPISYRSEFFNPASLWLGENYKEVSIALEEEGFEYQINLGFEENKLLMNEILYKKGVIKPGEEDWLEYDPSESAKILDEAGWTLKPGETYRTNEEGEVMSFDLYFVNSFDRYNVASYIKQDLANVGIECVIDRRQQPGQDSSSDALNGWGLDELNNQVLAPRLFDVILYGMNTFVDPDRYELFHSSQQTHPGLNIAGYSGSVEGVQVLSADERESDDEGLVRVPKIDRILDDTRSFDPVAAKQRRLDEYYEFQHLLINDFPVVFLYHPEFIYYANDSVSGIELSSSNSLQERFKSINEWEIL